MCGSKVVRFFDMREILVICCPLRGKRVVVQFANLSARSVQRPTVFMCLNSTRLLNIWMALRRKWRHIFLCVLFESCFLTFTRLSGG